MVAVVPVTTVLILLMLGAGVSGVLAVVNVRIGSLTVVLLLLSVELI